MRPVRCTTWRAPATRTRSWLLWRPWSSPRSAWLTRCLATGPRPRMRRRKPSPGRGGSWASFDPKCPCGRGFSRSSSTSAATFAGRAGFAWSGRPTRFRPTAIPSRGWNASISHGRSGAFENLTARRYFCTSISTFQLTKSLLHLGFPPQRIEKHRQTAQERNQASHSAKQDGASLFQKTAPGWRGCQINCAHDFQVEGCLAATR